MNWARFFETCGELREAMSDLEEQWHDNEWAERIGDNIAPLAFVLAFVMGLGSCAWMTVERVVSKPPALESGQVADRTGPANPWALDPDAMGKSREERLN